MAAQSAGTLDRGPRQFIVCCATSSMLVSTGHRPYNCIFRSGNLVGIIDFDSAAPGSRLWDLAYAAYTFVPLYCDDNCRAVGLVEPPNRGHRLRMFCDSYGLGKRTGFVQTIEERVRAVGAMIRTQAKGGDIRFQRMVDEGHADRYDANATYLHQHREELQRALQSASGKTPVDSCPNTRERTWS